MQCCYIEHKKYQMGEYLYRNNKMERSLADTKFWVNKNYDFDVMYKNDQECYCNAKRFTRLEVFIAIALIQLSMRLSTAVRPKQIIKQIEIF